MPTRLPELRISYSQKPIPEILKTMDSAEKVDMKKIIEEAENSLKTQIFANKKPKRKRKPRRVKNRKINGTIKFDLKNIK